MALASLSAESGVSFVHAAVPGRVRLNVTYFRGAPELKRALESELSGVKSIVSASAT